MQIYSLNTLEKYLNDSLLRSKEMASPKRDVFHLSHLSYLGEISAGDTDKVDTNIIILGIYSMLFNRKVHEVVYTANKMRSGFCLKWAHIILKKDMGWGQTVPERNGMLGQLF